MAHSDLTFIDIFCGAGGSSIGLTAAGYTLRLAANHWQRAIETHQANFRDAEHLCADVNNYDMRKLPRARVLWASPICTEGSPAGGTAKKRGRRRAEQLDILGDQDEEQARAMDEAGWERTRATAFDVIRATEVWNYDAILIENVVEFALDWPRFDWWLRGLTEFGYQHHIVCANSAHLWGPGNAPAPQWRDRMYIVFLREGIAMPDLEPRPLAHCVECGQDVRARQTWKDTPQVRRVGRIGKYRDQYVYTCPNIDRRHESWTVEPYVLPAASAIDWSDLGTRIGDRKRTEAKPEGLAPATIGKIRAGLKKIENHRTATAAWAPTPSPFVVELRGGGSSTRPVGHPLATITADGNHHGLCVPSDEAGWDGGHRLVIPFRNARPTTTATPLHTIATLESAGLAVPRADIQDVRFRMLRAREHLRAQRFADSYTVKGTPKEQTTQAGNAVSCNAAQWVAERVAAAL